MGLNYSKLNILHDHFNDIAKEVALENGALFIDLANSKTWTSEDLYDGLHFTDKASIYISEIISKALQNDLINRGVVLKP